MWTALVLQFCLVVPLLALSNNTLIGSWQNDQGLFLTINYAKNGQLSGMYEVLKDNELQKHAVTGSYDSTITGRTLGWTVTWSNVLYSSAHSTTAWSGRYYDADTSNDHMAKIVATWIQTSDTKPESEWEATVVGKSDFLYYHKWQ